MFPPTTGPWNGATELERSRWAAEQYALLTAALACRRARRLAAREFRLRRWRHRTAQWLVATAQRLDAT